MIQEIARKRRLMRDDFEKIYNEYFPKIYNYIFYRLMSREDTEELVSEVFIKVATNLERFDSEKAQFKTWIYRIAQNTLIDFYRTRKPAASLDDENVDWEPSVDFEAQLESITSPKRRAIYQALTKLKERERMIIYYRFFEEYTNREIAKLLQMNESTVGTVLNRALKKLKTNELRDML